MASHQHVVGLEPDGPRHEVRFYLEAQVSRSLKAGLSPMALVGAPKFSKDCRSVHIATQI